MVVKKKVNKGVQKAPVKKVVAKPVKKVIIKKSVNKPEAPVVKKVVARPSSNKIQTNEGWKRTMMRDKGKQRPRKIT